MPAFKLCRINLLLYYVINLVFLDYLIDNQAQIHKAKRFLIQ